MPINQAAKRIVCAVRIAFRAARILATDRSLPKLLRILFVIGLVQLPMLPTDELAMAIALAWLLLFHRPALARAMREARVQPEPKERKIMTTRKLAVAAASVIAALAAVVSLELGIVPASASAAHRVPLATAVVTVGRMIRMPVSTGRDGYPVPRPAVCKREASRPGHVQPAPEVGASGLTWLYVTAGTARELGIPRCSVVIAGDGQSVIVTPSGRVAGRS